MVAAFWLLLRVQGSAQVPQYLLPLPTSLLFRPVAVVTVVVIEVVVLVLVLVPVPGVHLGGSVSNRSKVGTTGAYWECQVLT